jgi:hypothetical protein
VFVFVTFACCYFIEIYLKAQAYLQKMLKKTTVCKNHKHGRILEHMSIIIKAMPASKPRTENAKQVSLFYAAILVIFVVTQLFTFDSFNELIPGFNLPLGAVLIYALAPSLIAAELFSLPFLLRMKLSIGFRWFSMLLGWLVPIAWAFISIWVVTTQPAAQTIGFLGTLVDTVPGWWAVFVSFALGILAAWSSWGLWPGSILKTKK